MLADAAGLRSLDWSLVDVTLIVMRFASGICIRLQVALELEYTG